MVRDARYMQADVEVTFSFSSLEKAEPFDPKWVNAQDLCAQKGSKVEGGVGPFGLLTLASKNLEEFTPVFFRIFEAPNKHVVLLCSDASRFVSQTLITLVLIGQYMCFDFFGFPQQFIFEESCVQAIICWLCGRGFSG